MPSVQFFGGWYLKYLSRSGANCVGPELGGVKAIQSTLISNRDQYGY